MLFRYALAIICLLCGPSLFAKNHLDRYNPFKDQHHTVEDVPASPEVRSTDFLDDEPEDVSERTDDFDDSDSDYDDDLDLGNHGPLGAICSDLAHYCSYFARNMMSDAQQKRDRNSLLLFCNVMELMADLADYEVAPIRAEHYACDIIRVCSSLRTAFESDADLVTKREKFPLLQKLMYMKQRSGDDQDLNIELDIYFHNMLRSKESAQPLVDALFTELNTYTQEKAHALLNVFHHDSLQLIDLSQRHTERSPRRSAGPAPEERRHLRQMSWLCHHASDACMDLAGALGGSSLMVQAAPLIKQLQSMLSAMSLTYDQLGGDPATVRSHSKSELAEHFANMIHLMPQTAPKRSTPGSPGTAYIDRCSQLSTAQDKKYFVEEAFSSELDRQALLAEFFPLFEQAIDCNLDTFTSSLAEFTHATLNNCYWPEGLAE